MSNRALPPVSPASANSVSCDCWKRVGGGERGGAGVHARVARRALGRIAERSFGDEAARVDRPEGDARLDGGVDRRVELGLVVDAVEAKAAGEVDERFLLVQLAEHLGRGLQRGELAVGVEDVELAVVLAEGGARYRRCWRRRSSRRALALADDQGLEDAEQPVAVGGEVLQDVDGAALVAQDGDEIGRGHLRAEEMLGGGERAELVGRPHGGHVEVEGEQAAILIALASCGLGRDLRAGEAFVELDVLAAGLWRRQGVRRWRRGPGARRSEWSAERRLR